VQQDELRQILTSLATERLALLQRHEAGARVVSHYDFNNTYQYVIAREETHLGWLQDALAELESPWPTSVATPAVPTFPKPGKRPEVTAFRAVIEDDAAQLGAFVARWRAKVEPMTHARHRGMLGVVLGESLEHQRLFQQAASGMEDVLGKRTGGVARVGAVLPNRWQE
jgi:uncharacterized protein (DUF1501 family)